MDGSFGQVARLDSKNDAGNSTWYWVHLYCRCMVTEPRDTNKHGEVNWRHDEFTVLSDAEALELMGAHSCATSPK